jgi:D-3-phosphoglycerate dehydrogenase
MIAQMKRRIIARFGVGVDNVDIPAATSAGIVVTRVPDYCLDEVSNSRASSSAMGHAGGDV